MSNAILDLFAKTRTATPWSTTVSQGSFRLDAAFYSADSVDAQAILVQSGARLQRLEDLADVHCSGVRERAFVDRAFGVPLLTGSTLDVTTDDDLKHVSRVLTRNIASEALQTNDILISSAGTVGKADFVHRNHEGRLASQDVIRIRPRSADPPPGYIYAFLTSLIAQRLIVSQPAGSVIVRVYEENLETLAIPRLPRAVEARIASLITASFEARADARSLLSSADVEFLSSSRLPRLPDERHFRHSIGDEPALVTPTSLDVQSGDRVDSEYRLDARFYNSTAQRAIANIKKCRSDVKTVAELSRQVLMGPRFKRNYVQAAHGVPFLSGKNIVQVRPTDLNYLSKDQIADMQELRVKRGWTLITCSGTVGRTCFVWRNYEEYAASQHILRVIPDESEVDPGYLFAFLSSRYGYEQVRRFRHGSVIDEITDSQVEEVLVPRPSRKDQVAIGDKVREAYEKRAEAIRLEDDAQAILMKELTKVSGTGGA